MAARWECQIGCQSEKNQRFPDFLTLALSLRCGGGGDRRRQAGLTAFRKSGGFSTFSRNG